MVSLEYGKYVALQDFIDEHAQYPQKKLDELLTENNLVPSQYVNSTRKIQALWRKKEKK